MNMVVKDVYDILRDVNSPFKSYNIFMFAVPEDFQKSDKLPLIRITEVSSYQSSFASNKADQHTMMVQVDVWHTSVKNINDIYFAIDDLMEKHGYTNTMGGVDADIDFGNTLRMYKRYRTTKFK